MTKRKPAAPAPADKGPGKTTGPAKRKPTRGERNIAWIEKHCRIPEGKDTGKPVVLRPWQKRDIKRIYDNPDGTRTAIISFGKKNGKTALAACLLLLHLVGPESVPNTQLPSTAQSKEQAAVLFGLASKMVRLSPTLEPVVIIRDSFKELYAPERGTLYKALSADDSTKHGMSPIFTVHDELGQAQGPISKLYNAVENAMAAHDEPLSIIISTQAPNDGDLLSILIDDGLAGHDPHIVVSLYTADPEADPFDVETVRQANPAFGDFQNAREIMGQAAKAKRMPSMEPLYRNYTLNQRVEASSPFVTKTVWAENGAEPLPFGPVYGGLDLSETNDLTAFVLGSPAGGFLNVRPTFWLPEHAIDERSRLDRVPYNVWAKQGHLQLTPGRSIEYQFVAKEIARALREHDIRKIFFDRYNMKHLRPWLLQAGIPAAKIDEVFVEFGQGFVSMSPALRVTEELLLNGRVRHGNHPVLTMCAANAVVKRNEAGDRKLDKKRSRGRIDGMTGLVMCAAAADIGVSEGQVFPVPVESLLEDMRR